MAESGNRDASRDQTAMKDAWGWNGASQNDNDREGVGEAFVFRDFERSKIRFIRTAIDRSPVLTSAIFFAAASFWTVAMSAAAALHGDNNVMVNLTPHIALYMAGLGLFLYPLRLVWVPFLAFVLLFIYAFVQPFGGPHSWLSNPSVTLTVARDLLLLNVASGLVIAILLRLTFALVERRLRAHLADLVTTLFAFVFFVITCLGQLELTLLLVQSYTPDAKFDLGASLAYRELATMRIMRGGVVLTGFLMAAIEFPNRRNFELGIFASLIFCMLPLLQSMGFVLFPMLDVAMLAILIAVVFPVSMAITACLTGIPIYAAMTGQFLNDNPESLIAEPFLNRYALAALFLLVLVMAFRSYANNVRLMQESSMRRLNRVRDFAGVGLFSANLTTERYRLDSAASRLLGCDPEGPLDNFLTRFDIVARDRLTHALTQRAAVGDMLTLPLATADRGRAVLQVLVWSEDAASGDTVAYGLLLDITTETARKEALQQTLDTLSMREEKQRQLFSIVSHEVRTPASVISMLIDELPDTQDTPLRKRLRESADQLLSVLADMRQVVNPEKNLPVTRQPYVPAREAEKIVSSLQPTAAKFRITITLDLDKSAERAREGDKVRVQQVLSNLVRNALLHSRGRNVWLSFHTSTSATGTSFSVWRVRDDGHGIAPDDEATMFEPFERGGQDVRKRADGSGLGLFIARSAVQLLGGTLEYHRPPEGGSCFTVAVPEPLLATNATVPELLPVRIADPSLRIALAEDNPVVAEVMCARLLRDFPKLRLARNGADLLELFEEMRPDVVLTDLFMPEMDGDEVTAELRRRGFQGPIIGLTAAAVGEESDRFITAGADLVMFKPLNMDDLHRHLADHLARVQ